MTKFTVELKDNSYNRMHFEFEDLETAKTFVGVALEAANKERTEGLSATIEYVETFGKKEGE